MAVFSWKQGRLLTKWINVVLAYLKPFLSMKLLSLFKLGPNRNFRPLFQGVGLRLEAKFNWLAIGPVDNEGTSDVNRIH